MGTYSVTQFRNKTVVTTFFRYAWRYWLDFWYMSVQWWVTDQVYILFRFNDFWTLKFGQIFSCHHLISLWFEVLTWFLAWECIMTSYTSTLKFIVVEWFLANLHCWALKFCQIYSCHHFFFTMIWDIDLIFGMWVYIWVYRSSLNFVPIELRSDWMILG